MSYYFSKTLTAGFDRAVDLVKETMKTEGFGVVSEIDMQAKLKEKLGVDFKRYTILGACSPAFAYKALQLEDKIGTMLPCNVVVQEFDGKTEVAAVDPVASMQAIQNESLATIAEKVRGELRAAVEAI